MPPELQIDHLDNDKNNNKIDNLRVVTHSENQWNRKGSKGFFWVESQKKWRAFIGLNGKVKHLGMFETILDARACYLRHKRKRHIYDMDKDLTIGKGCEPYQPKEPKGFSFDKNCGKWSAYICADGKVWTLGRFTTLFDARCKYVSTKNHMESFKGVLTEREYLEAYHPKNNCRGFYIKGNKFITQYKHKNVGSYDTAIDAHIAYLKAKRNDKIGS